MEWNYPIAWHVPNLISICIDSIVDGEMSGKIYHCYSKEAVKFSNIIRMIEVAEAFFDQIRFPEASTQMRSFEKKEHVVEAKPEKICTPEDVVAKCGTEATFLLNVRYRQNSSWQGELQWIEGNITYQFASVLELIKILSNTMHER